MAKKYAALASVNASRASDNVVSAKKHLAAAEDELKSANKCVADAHLDVKEAEIFLASVEKRWKVVELDVDEPAAKKQRSDNCCASTPFISDAEWSSDVNKEKRSSFDIYTWDVTTCIREVDLALQYWEMDSGVDNEGDTRMKDSMQRLRSIFQTFLECLTMETDSRSYPGEYIFNFFHGACITHANVGIFIAFVRQVQDFIIDFKGGDSTSGSPALDKFGRCWYTFDN